MTEEEKAAFHARCDDYLISSDEYLTMQRLMAEFQDRVTQIFGAQDKPAMATAIGFVLGNWLTDADEVESYAVLTTVNPGLRVMAERRHHPPMHITFVEK